MLIIVSSIHTVTELAGSHEIHEADIFSNAGTAVILINVQTGLGFSLLASE